MQSFSEMINSPLKFKPEKNFPWKLSFMPSIPRIKLNDFHWALLIALAWGAIILSSHLLRLDGYGIEESAARVLLIIWSLSDQVISTAFLFGIPDMRALLFLPLGLYWPGSILAAKVYTLILSFIAILILYRWQKRNSSAEAALLASGLLLILPGLLIQIDQLATGPYLLLAFATGHWLNLRYRRSQRPLGGWFFFQLVLLAITISLHPAGLAYPIALAWSWYKTPVDGRQQRHIYIGIFLALLFITILNMAWGTTHWLANPLDALAQTLLGDAESNGSMGMLLALVVSLFIILLIFLQRSSLAKDMMTLTLVLATFIGLVNADGAWGLIAITTLLYLGIPRLLATNNAIQGNGFAQKRGITLALVFIASLLFTQANKAHYQLTERNQLSNAEQTIFALADIVRGEDSNDIIIMSQWPGKTMLAIHRPVLPLPRDYPDSKTLLRYLEGVSHIIFDPFDAGNQKLKDMLAMLSAETKTLVLDEHGVIVALRQQNNNDGEQKNSGKHP